jgi:predicted NUDIX family phosphoesterase
MEHVYVVKRYDLFDAAFPHGFLRQHSSDFELPVEKLVERAARRGFFIERRQAEIDSSFKQVIPYCLVLNGDSVYLLKRFGKQGESRLHNKLSVGVGGHINPVDTEHDILETGRLRELNEELLLDGDHSSCAVGIINDESNPVGSVHFGIVYAVRPENGRVLVREPNMMEGSFKPWPEVRRMALSGDFNFETWSQLILERVDSPSGLVP